MKKYLLVLGMLVITLASCKKSVDQNAVDDAAIQTYLKTNNITATKDASGLYYQVVTAGSATHPTASSTVNVGYSGILLNGNQFDQNSNFVITLTNAIQGWQIGLPKIGTGGEVRLFVPSSLGYGSSATGMIPPNSVLIFDIQLFSTN